MKPEIGAMFDGRYRLAELLGRGGMAEVWAARDQSSSRDVAIKMLREPADPASEVAKRLQREASIVQSIRSRHVCELLGSGTWDGVPYLVFERLQGESLGALLQRQGSLQMAEAAEIVAGILQGLVDAHRAGVIHRDLSPNNVFLQQSAGGRLVRILDFGVSMKTDSDSLLTAQGGTLGTLAFMAPEQAVSAHDVDERADLYALGAIAFRCLAGRLPFESNDVYVVVSLKAQLDPPSLQEVTGAQWPSDLERFLQSALARSPQARFPSAFAALNAWSAVAARNRNAPARRRDHEPEPKEDTRTLTLAGPTGKRSR
jgi:eukaryotic-like serine/threonine-protein kinase